MQRDYRAIAKRYLPKGWRLKERKSRHGNDGLADASRKTLYCPPLDDAYALYVALHEAGHIHLKHSICPGRSSKEQLAQQWIEEYEAETYAIATCRLEGVKVSRDTLAEARAYVGRMFHHRHDPSDLDHPHYRAALRFAFPKTWRQELMT